MRADVKVNDQNILAAEQTSIDRWEAGLALGGYILKDRLWFFGSYDRIGQTTDRIPQQGPAAGETYPFDSRSNVYIGKLTWNAGPSTRVVATVFGDPEERTGATGGAPGTGNLESTDPLTYSATSQTEQVRPTRIRPLSTTVDWCAHEHIGTH